MVLGQGLVCCDAQRSKSVQQTGVGCTATWDHHTVCAVGPTLESDLQAETKVRIPGKHALPMHSALAETLPTFGGKGLHPQ